MIKIEEVDNRIIESKKKLKSLSNDYKNNFLNIKNYIEKEVIEVENLLNKKLSVIPEINFNELNQNILYLKNEIQKRGCVIIRDVFDDNRIVKWNEEILKYIENNNYFEDQKKKVGMDQYFSNLSSGKPQIFGLYWSKPQIQIRQSKELDIVKKWLNNFWVSKKNNKQIFYPNKELVYADRLRIRSPGDSTLGLSPHCDCGSVERWIDTGYQKVYQNIFSGNFRDYNPFDSEFRDETDEIDSPAVDHVFRTFQGWVALTKQGPSDGTLQLIPIVKSIAYILTRALQDDVPNNELCGSEPARALSVNKQYHKLLLRALVSIPVMKPGDTVWWHPDVVHAVEDTHNGNEFSNVIYVGSTPYCTKNLKYSKKQLKNFLNGESPPDFAAENYEVNYSDRALVQDLTNLGKKQLGLEDW